MEVEYVDAREIALKILYKVETEKAYSNIAINKAFNNIRLSNLDRSFVTELVYGTLENQIFIDYIIQEFVKLKLMKINTWTLCILRLGIYQIFFLDRVPDFAAVNESVILSKIYCKKNSGFVNGVLRNIIRNKDKITLPDKEKEFEKFLSVKYSHPIWMVTRFLQYFPREFTEKLLESNNKTPELYVRVNTLKTTREKVIKLLNNMNIKVVINTYIPEALIIEAAFSDIEKLDLYKNGLIYIQDLGSMLVSRILDPNEGDFVIDICSAPGGKTTHMAELMDNKGKILARDIYDHKINLVRKNAKRLGVNIITSEKFNGQQLDKKLIETADKVLIDAPCSGLGIIRRKPEIKYSKNTHDLKSLNRIQSQILSNASKYVKKGGELVYSTCTIDPNENHKIIKDFLKLNPMYELVDINTLYRAIIPGEHKTNMIQLFPHIHGTDGFFIAKLTKKQ